MSEPKRWLDDDGAPPEAVEMLRSLRAPRPMSPRKRAALAGVVAGIAAQSPRIASGMLLLKAALVTTAVAGVAATGYWAMHRESAPIAAVRPVPTAEPESRSESPPPEIAPAETAMPAPVEMHPAAPAVSEKSAAHGDTLADEAALLEEARRALASSPSQALKILHQYRQKFPHGELTAERLFLSADAYARLGDKANAERQAKALREQFPSSAYARRLPAVLGEAAP
jgi:hypothetical protein